MEKKILVVYNDFLEGERLITILTEQMPGVLFEQKKTEEKILEAIENRKYMLVILDYSVFLEGVSGLKLIKLLLNTNPFVKLICLSADLSNDFSNRLKAAVDQQRLVEIVGKRRLQILVQELKLILDHYFKKVSKAHPKVNDGLFEYYQLSRNEQDRYKKELVFEGFIKMIFETCGYQVRRNRIAEKSLPEIDMVLINDVADPFFNVFGKYIWVDCVNNPGTVLSDSYLTGFFEKFKDAGISSLGIIATSGILEPEIFEEARTSIPEHGQVIILAHHEILRLIHSWDKQEELKMIIDEQLNCKQLK